jgi:CubicO group peptidase (beta-lactamase class C family)
VVLTLRAIERGQFDLTTRISDLVPEFSGHGREKIEIHHLLTHSSGLPSVYSPREGMYIDVLDDVIAEICKNIFPQDPPGQFVRYAPICHHALLGDALRRTDPKKRSYRAICEQELLKPLGMKDTAIGLRRDLRKRHLVPVFRGNSPTQHLGHSNLGINGAFEEEFAEMPWVGGVSTAADMYRFAEMLRREGELDGKRILSPTIVRRAHHCWTGEKPNELYKKIFENRGWEVLPAYIGLGFSLRGERMGHALFGTLTSPETFGNHGAGTTLFWVDPELDMSFVGLATGVMNSDVNIERWQRLSDIAVTAAT